jgi:hypothetical protein
MVGAVLVALPAFGQVGDQRRLDACDGAGAENGFAGDHSQQVRSSRSASWEAHPAAAKLETHVSEIRVIARHWRAIREVKALR